MIFPDKNLGVPNREKDHNPGGGKREVRGVGTPGFLVLFVLIKHAVLNRGTAAAVLPRHSSAPCGQPLG